MHGIISKQRLNCLYREAEELAFTLTKYWNHNLSTSISKLRYEKIWKTINYLFIHGYDESKQNEGLLKTKGVTYFYELGTEKVKQDIQEIKGILKKQRESYLRFPNERFHSIVHQQIPDYMNTLEGWDEVFHYHHIIEDLDYPLFDGLPLFHDMYHLDGTDLVLYYMNRFQLEAGFCELFLDDLVALLEDYQQQKGVEVAYLGVNVFEMVVYQVLACVMLHQKRGILLSKTDVIRLHHQLNIHPRPHDLIAQAIKQLQDYFDSAIVSYISSFQSIIIKEILRFYKEGYERFIYPVSNLNKTVIKLDMAKADVEYQHDLDHLQSLPDYPSKVQYIQEQSFSIYDLIDLLDNDVFVNDEYRQFFDALSVLEIAIIIHVFNPTLFAFHQACKIGESLFEELNLGHEWGNYFIDSLRFASLQRKKAIELALQQLVIQ